jgi:hypothetical protein
MRETLNCKRVDVAICGSNKYGHYQKISCEQTINLFLSDKWLINTAGYERVLELVSTVTQGRGLFTSIRGNILIAVIGSFVYSINSNLLSTFIGTLNSSVGEVVIDENLNSQICIVDGQSAYIYNYSLGFPNLNLQTTAGLFPNYVCFHNGFFLFGNNDKTANGSSWFAYIYDTQTTIKAATPASYTLQTKPDYAIAVIRLPGQAANVMVFGTAVCEIWTQIGGLQNYRRNSTISVDYGCISINTIVTSDSYVAWLAVNENNAPVIMIYTGQGAIPISTDGIDSQLSKIQYPEQSTAMFYRQDGHLFYQLTFYNPVDNLTFLYDVEAKSFYTLTDANMNYHPAREYTYFDNNIYFISINNGSLYWTSTDLTTYNENLYNGPQDPENEYDIPRIRITNTIRSADSSQFRVNTFSFTIEQGCDPNVTDISLFNNTQYILTEPAFFPPNTPIYTEYGMPMEIEGAGELAGVSDGVGIIPYQPRVDLSVSRDGGITWSNVISRNLHTLGNRQNILNWDKMGSANSITFKLRFEGTYRFVAYDGFCELY